MRLQKHLEGTCTSVIVHAAGLSKVLTPIVAKVLVGKIWEKLQS